MFSKRYFPERLELDSFTTNTATSYNLFLLTYHKQPSELQSTMCFFFFTSGTFGIQRSHKFTVTLICADDYIKEIKILVLIIL